MKTIIQDLSQACERNAQACEIGGDAITLIRRKAETGIDIIGAVGSAYRNQPAAGTLTDQDLVSEWAATGEN